jgi:hypothetical protein
MIIPIGNSKEDIGFSVHTVLAMNPQTQQLFGSITQIPSWVVTFFLK